ncbi:MAG: hypothetical protein AAFX06_06650 [Planctomycetota bacterium]
MWNNSPNNPYTSSGLAGAGAASPATASIQAASRAGLIITFVISQALLVMAGIAAYLGIQNVPPGAQAFRFDSGSILFLGIGFGVFFINCVLAFVLPMAMKAKAIQDFRSAGEPLPHPLNEDTELPPSARSLLSASATWRLISQALLEGGAMINAVFLFVESNMIFAIPVLIAFVGIGIQAPFGSRLRAMLENAAAGD